MTSVRVQQILVVDDEDRIRALVGSYLRAEGFEVDEATSGEEAVSKVRERQPDLVVLDVRLPGIDGFEALREIRRDSDVYVIMLTARTEEADKLVGLTVGADDYMTKPFSPRELVARVKAVLRRGRQPRREDEELLRFEGLEIDLAGREARRDGTPVELTALEFDLLAALASAPGRVFTRRQLIERVWGWDFFGDERVVDVHIRNLRRALDDSVDAPRFVGTIRGVGYKLVAEPR
jgi:DNA-binding response OmpR family regulator